MYAQLTGTMLVAAKHNFDLSLLFLKNLMNDKTPGHSESTRILILIQWEQKCISPLYIYTEQNYKRNTFVFAPIFHELNSKISYFFYVHKRPFSLKYCSQIGLNLC